MEEIPDLDTKHVRRLARRWAIIADCLERVADSNDVIYIRKQLCIVDEQVSMALALMRDYVASKQPMPLLDSAEVQP